METTAILPVKRFGNAKQRLLDALDRPQRAALVKAMLTDVVTAICATDRVERLIVVTGEGRAERIALELARSSPIPVEVLQDPADRGHSEAAVLGIVRPLHHGADCAALLPGDCPMLAPTELDAALGRMRPGRVAVIPDRHGSGTNGLLMSPADAIGPAFGPGSRARHLERAERAGYKAAIESLPSLALDLDTPDDLGALAAAVAASPQSAPVTATALAELGVQRQ